MHGQSDAQPSHRHVMGSFPTGVTIVASRDSDGVPFGLTVNSFTSLSLEPPLILVCVGHSSTSHDRLIAGSHFSVNFLSAEQVDVASRFAREPSAGRFDDVEWRGTPSGCPVLDGVTAALDCAVHEVLQGGDHTILVGRVEGSWLNDRPAMVFHRGRFSSTDG